MTSKENSNLAWLGIIILLIAFFVPKLFSGNNIRVIEQICMLEGFEGKDKSVVHYTCSDYNLAANTDSKGLVEKVFVTADYGDNRYQLTEAAGYITWLYQSKKELNIGDELRVELPNNKKPVSLDLSNDFALGEPGDVSELSLQIDSYGNLLEKDGFNLAQPNVHPQGLSSDNTGEVQTVTFCVINGQLVSYKDVLIDVFLKDPEAGYLTEYGSRPLDKSETYVVNEAVLKKDQLVKIQALHANDRYSLVASEEVSDLSDCKGYGDPQGRTVTEVRNEKDFLNEVIQRDMGVRYRNDPKPWYTYPVIIISIPIVILAVGHVSAFIKEMLESY